MVIALISIYIRSLIPLKVEQKKAGKAEKNDEVIMYIKFILGWGGDEALNVS